MRAISLSICLLFFLTSYGQERRSLDFAISLIPQVSQQVIEDAQVIDSYQKFGFGLRGDVFFKLNPSWQVNTGLFYQLTQVHQNDYSIKMACDFHSSAPDILDSWYEDEFSLHYLGIPLELRYFPSRTSKGLYLSTGLNPALNLSYNRMTISHNCFGSEVEDHEYLNRPKRLQLLGNFGIGYDIELGGKSVLLVEPRIGYSLNRIFNELKTGTFATNDSRLLTWGIRLGIMIN